MSYGIPFIYYATEAGFSGTKDPENREWFNPFYQHASQLDKGISHYIKTLNKVRKAHRTYDYAPKFINTDSSQLVFTKGSNILVVVSND